MDKIISQFSGTRFWQKRVSIILSTSVQYDESWLKGTPKLNLQLESASEWTKNVDNITVHYYNYQLFIIIY